MTIRGIGVFGGTFDPIHVGHLAAAEEAAWRLDLERVLFVPNNVPPHKRDQTVSEAGHRRAMVEAAVRDNPRFEVSELELDRTGPSYTLDTMRQLRSATANEVRLIFLAGRDALLDLHTWHRPHELLEEFELVFLCRPDTGRIDWTQFDAQFPGMQDRIRLIDVPALQISSSDIRRRVREGRPIRYYATAPVARYIEQYGLYHDSDRAR